jgi:hypothetical protein
MVGRTLSNYEISEKLGKDTISHIRTRVLLSIYSCKFDD